MDAPLPVELSPKVQLYDVILSAGSAEAVKPTVFPMTAWVVVAVITALLGAGPAPVPPPTVTVPGMVTDPTLLLTRIDTEYTPGARYWCLAVIPVPEVLSPNVHWTVWHELRV